MNSGCSKKEGTGSSDVPEQVVVDQYKPKYGEQDPIALSDAQAGGFHNLGRFLPKSLNMFLDYNRFSANVMGLF